MNQTARLVGLHRRRESQAERHLVGMKHELAQREAVRNDAQHAWSEHVRETPAREQALYGTILGKVVTREKVDIVNEKIEIRRAEERTLRAQYEQTEVAVTEASRMVEDARVDLQHKRVRTEKYAEVDRQMQFRADDVLQRKEEIELEELIRRAR